MDRRDFLKFLSVLPGIKPSLDLFDTPSEEEAVTEEAHIVTEYITESFSRPGWLSCGASPAPAVGWSGYTGPPMPMPGMVTWRRVERPRLPSPPGTFALKDPNDYK